MTARMIVCQPTDVTSDHSAQSIVLTVIILAWCCEDLETPVKRAHMKPPARRPGVVLEKRWDSARVAWALRPHPCSECLDAIDDSREPEGVEQVKGMLAMRELGKHHRAG